MIMMMVMEVIVSFGSTLVPKNRKEETRKKRERHGNRFRGKVFCKRAAFPPASPDFIFQSRRQTVREKEAVRSQVRGRDMIEGAQEQDQDPDDGAAARKVPSPVPGLSRPAHSKLRRHNNNVTHTHRTQEPSPRR